MYRLAETKPESRPHLAWTAAERLRQSSHTSLWSITCDDCDGVLTLRGRIGSYHLKQLAQEIVGRIAGVEEIVNRLEVLDSVGSPQPAAVAGGISRFRSR